MLIRHNRVAFAPANDTGAGASPQSAAPQGAAPSASAPQPPPGPEPPPTPTVDYRAEYERLKQYEPYEQAVTFDGPDGSKVKLTPDQLKQSIDFARRVAADMQAGKLSYAQAQAAIQANQQAQGQPQQAQDPFGEDFEALSPREQFQKFQQLVDQKVSQTVAEKQKEFEQGLQNWQGQYGTQLDLLTRALEAKIANPSIDITQLLNKGVELSRKSPAELLQMAMQNMLAPQLQEAELNRRVEEKLALQKQEAEAKQLERLSGRGAYPRLVRNGEPVQNRQAQENQDILKRAMAAGILK